MTADTLWHLVPELVVVAAAMIFYMAGTTKAAQKHGKWLASVGLIAASVSLAIQRDVGGLLVQDGLATLGRWLALVVGLGLVLIADQRRPAAKSAYLGSLLLAVAGLMITAAASDLVALFVGIELVMLPVYMLLYLDHRDDTAVETIIKRFFLNVLASALFVYGLSFLYGIAGSINLDAVRIALAGADSSSNTALAGVALVLIVVGLGFRITAVPLHFGVSDVFQNTSYSNAAMLSVMPKAAGFFVLIRLLVSAMPCVASEACQLVMLLAVLSMTVGQVMALRQERLNRLLAYSSIAYTGYLLVAISVALATEGQSMCWYPLAAMLYSLVVYALAMLGVFAALAYLGRSGQQIDHVDELAGLARTHPTIAASLAIALLSLAGLPPLAGFWGQLAIFAGALEAGIMPSGLAGVPGAWFIALAVVGVFNMAVAAAYYLRIVGVIYFRLPLGVLRAEGGHAVWVVAVICALAIVGLGLHAGPLWSWTLEVGQSVTVEPP